MRYVGKGVRLGEADLLFHVERTLFYARRFDVKLVKLFWISAGSATLKGKTKCAYARDLCEPTDVPFTDFRRAVDRSHASLFGERLADDIITKPFVVMIFLKVSLRLPPIWKNVIDTTGGLCEIMLNQLLGMNQKLGQQTHGECGPYLNGARFSTGCRNR